MAHGYGTTTRILPSLISPHSRGSLELFARHQIAPYQQGQLDGLCALISAINAMRLSLASVMPLSPGQCRSLFAVGVAYLDRKGGLHDGVVDGIDVRRRLALTRHLAKRVSATNCQVSVERPDCKQWASIDALFAWVADSLSLGRPVLITLTGGLEHHTVVAGMTPATLQLFDSSGQRFLRKSSCGVRSGYYQIQGLARIALQRLD